MLQFQIRPPGPNDLNFILSATLKSARNTGDKTYIGQAHYYADYGETGRVTRMLQDAQALIACNPEDTEQIYGFVIHSAPRTLEYVYVKQWAREQGVAHALINQAMPRFGEVETTVSALPKDFRRRAEKYRLNFNPYPRQNHE